MRWIFALIASLVISSAQAAYFHQVYTFTGSEFGGGGGVELIGDYSKYPSGFEVGTQYSFSLPLPDPPDPLFGPFVGYHLYLQFSSELSFHSSIFRPCDGNQPLSGCRRAFQDEPWPIIVDSTHRDVSFFFLFTPINSNPMPNGVLTIDLFVPDDFVAAAVPEPSTWAMMIVGFLGLGLLAARHSKNSLSPHAALS